MSGVAGGQSDGGGTLELKGMVRCGADGKCNGNLRMHAEHAVINYSGIGDRGKTVRGGEDVVTSRFCFGVGCKAGCGVAFFSPGVCVVSDVGPVV